jgi:hypothetical protein
MELFEEADQSGRNLNGMSGASDPSHLIEAKANFGNRNALVVAIPFDAAILQSKPFWRKSKIQPDEKLLFLRNPADRGNTQMAI